MDYILDIPKIVDRDIEDIHDYIARHNTAAAKKVAKGLTKAIERLLLSPFAYPKMSEKFAVETDLMASYEGHFVILFRVDGNLIKVYRVLDTRSDYLVRLGVIHRDED